uniref:Uncharacterized protein n=1 Tax=Aegilops tauschii subsp. strangulata TaxID=200361 RepID=A0A452XMW9_AEGTS
MSTIDELRLRAVPVPDPEGAARCDVRHDVPAVVFSTGGYTGNVYHEFNDGIIPLYITARRYNRKVVFVMLEYHDWWMTKYGHIVEQLSDFPPVDFSNDPHALLPGGRRRPAHPRRARHRRGTDAGKPGHTGLPAHARRRAPRPHQRDHRGGECRATSLTGGGGTSEERRHGAARGR